MRKTHSHAAALTCWMNAQDGSFYGFPLNNVIQAACAIFGTACAPRINFPGSTPLG